VGFAARAAGIVERFLVVNGDVLTDLDITAMVEFHEGVQAEGTISLAEVADPSAFGLVPTDPEGRVLAFVEKPPAGQSHAPGGGSLINAGTYVLEPSVLDRIPTGRRVSIEREVFPSLATGGRLYGFASKDYWTDTGTPLQYLQAQLDLIARPGGEPPLPGAHPLTDGVWGVNQPVVDGEVRGPALIGAGAHVEAGATVDCSVVGAGGRVWPGARVSGSVLLPGAVVKAGAVVTGSIIGAGSVVGGGAELTGLTVIGPNVEVAAGERLDGARVPDAE
jgi:NDP-sugar pyrophosphorylase family protein